MNIANAVACRLLAGTALIGLCMPMAAHAQDPKPVEDAPSLPVKAKAEPAATAAAAEDEMIVVTGSRVRNTPYSSTSSVTIIDARASAETGKISATEILQSSPVTSGTGQVNNNFTGLVVGGGAGINTISLRGLGAQRSLVLLNGRRLPPSGVGGSVGPVDLNSIPSAVVARYEILKDGASSVYGSDAVAGVVNVITRSRTEGLELRGSGTAPQRGGGGSYDIAGTWGKILDNGYFSVSGEYFKQQALTARQRKGFACPQHQYYKPDGSRADLIDPATGEFKCYLNRNPEGSVYAYYPVEYTGSPIVANVFKSRTGAVSDNVRGFAPVEGIADQSYADPRELATTIFSPSERATAFVQGEIDPEWLGASLYTELMWNNRRSSQVGFSVFRPVYARDSTANPFTTAVVPGLEANGELGYVARPNALYEVSGKQSVNLYRGLLGGKGSVGKFAYDAYVSHALSIGNYSSDAIYNDRVAFGTGTDQNTLRGLDAGVCGAGAPKGCVPLDLFTRGALEDGKVSDAVRDYYFTRDHGKTRYTQSIAEVSATGDLFDLPYGAVGSAFGVSFRREAIDDDPGALSTSHNIWGRLTSGATRGNDTVAEIYGELEGPILRDLPLVKDLKLNLSGRYSRYGSVGGAATYKVGLNWAVDDTIRFRGTYGTSFRAPSLYELYLNDQRGFLEQSNVDPCVGYGQTDANGLFLQTNDRIRANCAAAGIPTNFAGGLNQVTVSAQGGGDDLKPERSTAMTLGVALTPPSSGVKLAVDYWNIKVKDQIGNVGAGAPYGCYSSDDYTVSGYCALFERSPVDFGIAQINSAYTNTPFEKSSGVDVTGSYDKQFNIGTFSADLTASYILEHKIQPFAGDTVYEYIGMLGYPKLVGNLNTSFKFRSFTVGTTVNYTGPTSNLGRYGETGKLIGGYAAGASYKASTGAFVTGDLFVSVTVRSWQLVTGVKNVLDQHPPVIGEGASYNRIGNYPMSSQYADGYLGRQAYFLIFKTF